MFATGVFLAAPRQTLGSNLERNRPSVFDCSAAETKPAEGITRKQPKAGGGEKYPGQAASGWPVRPGEIRWFAVGLLHCGRGAEPRRQGQRLQRSGRRRRNPRPAAAINIFFGGGAMPS